MLKIKQFVKVSSIEEAYELNQQKNNIVIVRNREIKNLPVKIKIRGFKYSIIER